MNVGSEFKSSQIVNKEYGFNMNIFILDYDLEKSAKYHCDKHVVKMILESVQLLCTSLHESKEIYNIIKPVEIPYKSTHKNHPCAIWARESITNYNLLALITFHLAQEFKFRFNKDHKSYVTAVTNRLINEEQILADNSEITYNNTHFVKCVPEDCLMDDVVDSYRYYYNKYKQHLFTWKNRNIPNWIAISL